MGILFSGVMSGVGGYGLLVGRVFSFQAAQSRVRLGRAWRWENGWSVSCAVYLTQCTPDSLFIVWRVLMPSRRLSCLSYPQLAPSDRQYYLYHCVKPLPCDNRCLGVVMSWVAVAWLELPCMPLIVYYLFIYYKIVHTVQDRQNGQSNIKSGIKAK